MSRPAPGDARALAAEVRRALVAEVRRTVEPFGDGVRLADEPSARICFLRGFGSWQRCRTDFMTERGWEAKIRFAAYSPQRELGRRREAAARREVAYALALCLGGLLPGDLLARIWAEVCWRD